MQKLSKTIKLIHLYHQKNNQIRIDFPYDVELIEVVKTIEGTLWSQEHKCWYLKNNKENLNKIFKAFMGIAWIDSKKLYGDVVRKKIFKREKIIKDLSSDAKKNIEKFHRYLDNRRYSKSTISTYISLVEVFLTYFKNKEGQDISEEEIIYFNHVYIIQGKYSITYQRQMICAIKMFYIQIYGVELKLEKLQKPRSETRLPIVLSKAEVEKIINEIVNLKHRTMISLAYSCGLRAGEVLKLKICDIDSSRSIIWIRQSKGKKDRMVNLSPKILDRLRVYYKQYRPKIILFEGANGYEYSYNSLNNIIRRASLKANIWKKVTIHTMRHSFATHLLESGVDLRYIQEILGHKSYKTTQIYTHVSTERIENITSPIDDLNIF
jgi:integrase/recombinase XerD